MKLIMCFLVFIQLQIISQDYFYKVNKVETNSVYYQSIYFYQSIFTITSNICQFRECGTVSELDLLGNIKWSLELPNTDVAPHSSSIYNDTLYVAGNYSPGDGITILHKISLDGVLQKSYLYSDPRKKINRSLILDLSRFKDKFIITGQGFTDEKSKGIIISIDSLMQLDTILIDTTLEISTVWDNFIGPDSLLTCFYYQVNEFWPNQVRRIIKYDAGFNQVWSYTSDTLGVNTSYPYGTVLRDGRVAFVDFRPGWPTGLNALRCLDTITKQNSWMYSYPFIQSWVRKLRSVKQLRNGDIICTGEYTTKATVPRIEGSPYMMRLDINGNLLWEHAYVEIAPDGEDKGGNLWDVIELDNGDLMAVGFVTNNNKWDPLIIRTDHRGCMDGGSTNCPTVRIIDLSSGAEDEISAHNNKKISIYPNPTAIGLFNVDVAKYSDGDDVVCAVYNIYGQQIHTQNIYQKTTMVEIPNATSGLYLVQIFVNNKTFYTEKLILR
ncbi:MAG: T9SS type A sorting domain-containing protein [Saprospiraceae bacterium]|nr:T9SS type A sorting domain-containing protein [Saprospiraceae bacterium]